MLINGKELIIAAYADLHGANLHAAYLSGAYLHGADLHGADLSGADLSGADLSGANLSGANLYAANLSGADLHAANLHAANLSGAYLYGAKVDKKQADMFSIVPETGAFEGWKKCRDGIIVRLLIQAKAMRSNATGRKCRASSVRVIEVIGAEKGISKHDGKTTYVKDKVLCVEDFDQDRWNECGTGIHFFLTRSEAENYQ